MGEPLRLICDIHAIPEPNVTWFKNGELIVNSDNDTRISIHEDKKALDIKFMQIEDEGEFKCVGINRVGTVEALTNLKISSKAYNFFLSNFFFIESFS